MATIIRRFKATWNRNDIVLARGVYGEELESGRLKLGDGRTYYSQLAFLPGGSTPTDPTPTDPTPTDPTPTNPGTPVDLSAYAKLVDLTQAIGTRVAEADFRERVEDAVAQLLAGGTGVTLNYEDNGDGNGKLTLTAASGGGGTTDPEVVRDVVGVALVGAGLINVAINDPGDTITFTTTATANSTDAQLRNRQTHTGDYIITGTNLATELNKKVDATVLTTELGKKANTTDFEEVTDEYVLKSIFDAQVSAILERVNTLEVAGGGQGGGTAPVNPTIDPTSGTSVFNRDFRTAIATTSGGTAGSQLNDPTNNFHIKYLNANGNMLGLWNADNATTKNYFLMLATALAGTSPFGVRLNSHSPTTSTTVAWPRAVLAANANAEPTSYYAVTRSSTGFPNITRTVDGASTTLATGTVANTAFDTELNSVFEPATGKITVYDGDTNNVLVEAIDPNPLTGRFCGLAMRSYSNQAGASSNQGVNRITINTY